MDIEDADMEQLRLLIDKKYYAGVKEGLSFINKKLILNDDIGVLTVKAYNAYNNQIRK